MMKRHRMVIPQFASTSNVDSITRQAASPQQAASNPNPSLVLSQSFSQPGNVSQMFQRAPDQPLRLDPRSAMITSSLPRSRIPGGSSMHVPNPQPTSMQPRRVSLLRDIRDIGIAGERDRDLPTSRQSIASAHGGSGSYPSQNINERHASAANSQMMHGIPQPYERPLPIVGTVPHSYQQHIPDQSSPYRHSATTYPMSHGANLIPITDIKKEPGAKQEHHTVKIPLNPSVHASMQGSVLPTFGVDIQHQQSGSAKSNVPGQQVGLVEQKSKEHLVQTMDKVDREISKIEQEINRLQKRKTQLEESAKKPPEPGKTESSSQSAEPKHRDLWQVIYAENRKKAEDARAVLDGICPTYEMPLYNQPLDTRVYQDNLKKNEEMRPKLLKYFQHRRKLLNIREKYLGARYDQLMDQWQKKAERIENNVKRKTKDAKTREFFEKLFPEVRKQREQQERVDRVGTRGDACRSDADFADIVDGLTEQENQLQHMRQLAVVPPMLLDKEERRITFISNNGYLSEPFKEFKESQQLDSWADHEKAIFKEKYVQHPKNFYLISSCIEKKSVADCILYYYLTKKTNKYKALVRKHTLKPRKPKSGRGHTSHHHDQSSASKDSVDKSEKDEVKKEAEDVDDLKIDKPPSPRLTRSRKQTMNWTEEEINLVKEGFGKHGRDFSSISRMVTNKSEQQVKNFYHNYKKKHGLDQLITDSKKKKTRTRHAATPTVDTSASSVVEDDSSASKKPDSTDSKNKSEKDKNDEILEEKKKNSDRTPSPAVSTKSDASDVTSLSTTHIRTRRTTAALAAAASQESQAAESGSGKRSLTDKSTPASGEPMEKKSKKSDRKTRNHKNSESSSKEVSVKTEAKDEVPTSSSQSESVDTKQMLVEGECVKKPISDATKPAEAPSHDTEKSDSSNDTEKTLPAPKKEKEAKAPKPDVASLAKPSTPKGPLPEDHDSSATCSADEETPLVDVTTSVAQARVKNENSPYGFDDDFNDSPTRIRLEAGRQPVVSSLAAISAISVSSSSSISVVRSSSASLSLESSKAAVTSMVMTPVYSASSRPQSLPPASMVPSVPLPVRTTTASSTSTSLSVPALDMSRPNSTPVFGDFALGSTTRGPMIFHPSMLSVAGPIYKPPQIFVTSGKSQPLPSAPPLVARIENLTYTGKKPKPNVPVVIKSPAAVVDLTKESSSVKQQPVVSSSTNVVKKVDDTAWNAPHQRHHYHPTHPSASSLQKDFHPSMAITSSASSGSHSLNPNYQRAYSEKDKQLMKDRAASIPEGPIPVSSLRFTSAGKSSSYLPQHYKNEPSTSVTNQVAAAKPYDLKLTSKEDIKQTPMGPVLLPSQPFSARSMMNIPRPTISSSDGGALTSAISTIHRPTMQSSLAPFTQPPSSSGIGLRPSSPDKIVSGHIVIPGSIVEGKPVFRAQTPKDKDKAKIAPPTSLRGSIVHGTPALNLVNSSRSTSSDPAPTRKLSQPVRDPFSIVGGLLPNFPPGSGTYGMRLPTTIIPPVKPDHGGDIHLSSKSVRVEDLRCSPRTSVPQAPRIDPHQIQNIGSIHPGINFIPAGSGSSIKSKVIDEANLSPRALSQRSMTPPHTKVERKSSLAPQPSFVFNPDATPSRHMSPAFQHGTEKHYKEEIRRPSSATRATPERSTLQESSPMSSHHRSLSTHSLPATKSRNVSLSDTLHTTQSVTSLNEQRLIAAATAPPMRLSTPFMPSYNISTAVDPKAFQTLLTQYMQLAGTYPYPSLVPFPPGGLVRPFSPSGTDNLESSRHNVLTQDFATAQRMQQHLAAGLPFPAATLPPGASLQGQPVLVTAPNPLIPPHHSGSPLNMERLNFIPQHSGMSSPLSSHASPRGSSSKTPVPHSPSSPHQPIKSHISSPAHNPYHHESSSSHLAVERRKSSSPSVASSHGIPASTSHSSTMMSRDQRQPSPMFHSTSRQMPIVKPGLSGTEAAMGSLDPSMMAAPRRNSPQLSSHSASPLAYQSPQVKSIKQEKLHEASDYDHARPTYSSERPRHYGQLQETLIRGSSSAALASETELAMKEKMLNQKQPSHLFDPNQRSPIPAASHGMVGQGVRSMSRGEFSEKQQQEKTAKDLRSKGKTTMTPATLISAIIDHKINQFGEDHIQEKVKHRSPDMVVGQHPERRVSSVMPGAVEHFDSKYNGNKQKVAPSKDIHPFPQEAAHSTRTKTLQEHYTDIISNIYSSGKEPPKHPPSEPRLIGNQPRPEELIPAQPRHQPAAGGGNDDKNKSSKTSQPQYSSNQATRHNVIMHPFAPQLLMTQDTHTSLDSIIREALMTNSTTPSSTSPPVNEVVRQQPRSNTGQSSPDVRASSSTFHPDYNPSYRSSSAELKRTESSHTNAAATPQMFSALSFRAGQSTNATQQVPPTNLPGRPHIPVAGSTSVPRSTTFTSSPGIFHTQMQMQTPQVERTPLSASAYEPLSDSD